VSLFNEILVGRYNAVLHKLLTMKDGAPAPTLATDIAAGITLEEDRPDWFFLGGEMLCSAPVLLAASPGNFGTAGLQAATTGVMAVVTGIIINNENAAAASFNIKQGGTPAGALFRSWPRDTRFLIPNTTRSNLQVGSATAAAAAGNLYQRVTLPAGGSIYIPTEYILVPGASGAQQLAVETGIANSIVSCTFIWRERVQEPSETR
jgi:hypothetical protein